MPTTIKEAHMRFIKTFWPFGFIAVIFVMFVTHYGDWDYGMPCILGIMGWLEYLELRHRVAEHF